MEKIKNNTNEAKVVLITGASSGLGKALAARFARENTHFIVYGTSRHPEIHTTRPYHLVTMDVCDPASVAVCVDQIIAKEGKIDILINNAGIGYAGPLEQFSNEQADKLIQTNISGVLYTMRAVLPHMRRQGSGRIINISSIGASFGLPYRSIYCASKAAVSILSQSLRMEVRSSGVQVAAVQAGDINTSINQRRMVDFDATDPYYKSSFERAYQKINEDVSQGSSAEFVAEAIYRIVQKKALRKNYNIGSLVQRIAVVLARIMPSPVFEGFLMKYSNI